MSSDTEPSPPSQTEVDEGKKHDKGKLDWALLPIPSMRQVVAVLMHGERTYGRDNWKKLRGKRVRYYNATMRHLTSWFDGEELDPDSGLPHLAHAICSCLFLLTDDEKEKEP